MTFVAHALPRTQGGEERGRTVTLLILFLASHCPVRMYPARLAQPAPPVESPLVPPALAGALTTARRGHSAQRQWVPNWQRGRK